MPVKVSIVIPCYNASQKIGRCLASLRRIDFPVEDYEVLFIDDASTDATHEILERQCAKRDNWSVTRLEQNSGSASRPRNRGMELARGEYLFFLDCDDEILPDTIKQYHEQVKRTDACIVRGYLLADDGTQVVAMNRVEGWSESLGRRERIERIIASQSTTSPSLIRASVPREASIRWPEEALYGEDTLFLVDMLCAAEKIEYIDHPTFVYHKRPSFVGSITRSYGARELRSHLAVWRAVTAKLATIDIDYRRIRLEAGLRFALGAMIFRNRYDIDEAAFGDFSAFVRADWEIISTYDYIARFKEILEAVRTGNYREFMRLCRPRLLIAGHNLAFLLHALPDLEPYFDIKVDEWIGHDRQNEQQSRRLLGWAEFIWCEWLLGNAVWYAANKRASQRLVVRTHRFELSREFGEETQAEKVDAFLAVSVLFFERLLERFPKIPRAKVRLLPNYVMTGEYARGYSDDRLFTLGMIGILPARKRLDVALDILDRLRRQDARYRLRIFGRQPEELSWVKEDAEEMRYFERCRNFIEERGLSGAVEFCGHCDMRTALDEHQVGFVLSVSDTEDGFPGPESFHLAVADAFAGGAVGLILRWAGCEYVWPEDAIFDTVDQMVERILSFRDAPEQFRAASDQGLRFVEERYGVDKFVREVRGLFQELA